MSSLRRSTKQTTKVGRLRGSASTSGAPTATNGIPGEEGNTPVSSGGLSEEGPSTGSNSVPSGPVLKTLREVWPTSPTFLKKRKRAGASPPAEDKDLREKVVTEDGEESQPAPTPPLLPDEHASSDHARTVCEPHPESSVELPVRRIPKKTNRKQPDDSSDESTGAPPSRATRVTVATTAAPPPLDFSTVGGQMLLSRPVVTSFFQKLAAWRHDSAHAGDSGTQYRNQSLIAPRVAGWLSNLCDTDYNLDSDVRTEWQRFSDEELHTH
eukprot:gene18315-13162_t